MEAKINEAARSLWVIYRHMPTDVQQAFKRMIDEGDSYVNEQWTPLSDPSLKGIWESPDEDYWDELYTKLHAK
ncbi:hypothetical protein [Rudanella lutea]|jgi:hypothetical protein|uniref:hypothetical protein n=1 Tax=Rudanella lutea TaxID=451374 RepID=UPI000372EF3A|nr:hypothetical protein [Rudanella lutea]